jgi:D-alanyl-D-alanine carboxypeptidase/D-alanyl-D-alanine-endopeptidase (penicillin-binding protein 4)
LPGGWIWDDIGNYYGAGSWGFNWRENQFDLLLKPGPLVNSKTSIIKTVPSLTDYNLGNFITTGEKGSGDNGYIYYAPYGKKGFATGTIPAGVESFTISGSMPDPARQFGFTLINYLKKDRIAVNGTTKVYTDSFLAAKGVRRATHILDSLISPPLDSVVYWFLKKSINFYGETLLRTLAFEKIKVGSGDSAILIIKKFWKDKGLDEEELNMNDGSGLSPLNRVTTHAQVEILRYARTRDWYQYFYDALPEYNGMKMKSGTISDVKGFCGYQKSKDGHEYIFSFLVNNYSGRSSLLVEKMYEVLNELK